MSLMIEWNDPLLLLEGDHRVSFSLDRFLRQVLSVLGIPKGAFSVTFLDDDRMSDIHECHLGVSGSTDIVTYNLADTGFDVDIYIGLQTVFHNAKEYGMLYEDELKMVIVHGILHVLGWDDQIESDRESMFLEQDRVLRVVGSVLNS